MCIVKDVSGDTVTVCYDGDTHDTEFTIKQFTFLFYSLEGMKP